LSFIQIHEAARAIEACIGIKAYLSFSSPPNCQKFVQLILFLFYPVVKHYIVYYTRRVDPSSVTYVSINIVMSSITKSSNSNFQQNMSSSPPTTHAMAAHPQGGYNPSAIQAWTQSLPAHTVSSGRSQHANDAAVQAYLQAKMALFSRH
jgi:hypothetical protein